MPRYFLNIRDGDFLIVDPDGDDLPSPDDAHALVLDIIRDIRARPETYGSRQVWNGRRFEVTDETGTVLMTIKFPSV